MNKPTRPFDNLFMDDFIKFENYGEIIFENIIVENNKLHSDNGFILIYEEVSLNLISCIFNKLDLQPPLTKEKRIGGFLSAHKENKINVMLCHFSNITNGQ